MLDLPPYLGKSHTDQKLRWKGTVTLQVTRFCPLPFVADPDRNVYIYDTPSMPVHMTPGVPGRHVVYANTPGRFSWVLDCGAGANLRGDQVFQSYERDCLKSVDEEITYEDSSQPFSRINQE